MAQLEQQEAQQFPNRNKAFDKHIIYLLGRHFSKIFGDRDEHTNWKVDLLQSPELIYLLLLVHKISMHRQHLVLRNLILIISNGRFQDAPPMELRSLKNQSYLHLHTEQRKNRYCKECQKTYVAPQ